MNKVISINLNGNAYQLEEQGYEAMDTYLREARRQLTGNPDLEEILKDLEQAIADKCNRFLKTGKTVVLGTEVLEIIEEMGPVRDSMDSSGEAGEGTEQAETDRHDSYSDGGKWESSRTPRKLYRLRDNKMVEGICSGIAAYLGIDPIIIRILFVALLIFTSGVAAIIYLIMALIIPEAKTPEEHAAAHGTPFDAREVVERARSKFQGFQDNARETQKQKAGSEYRRGYKPEKPGGCFSKLLILVVIIIGVSALLKFLYWPFYPNFMHTFGIYKYMPFWGFHTYNPWISILVLLVLIYVLGRLINNISASENGENSLLAGILKLCLFGLVVLFAIRMFPVMIWILREIISFFRHTFHIWY